MIFGFTPIELIGNMILFTEFFLFSDRVMTCRIRCWARYFLYVLCVILLIYLGTLPPKMSVLRVFSVPLQLMVYNLLLFKDTPLRSVFCAWIVTAVMILSEYIVVCIYYPPRLLAAQMMDAPVGEQITLWITDIACAALLLWLAALCMNRVRNRFTLREMLMYAFFPISQCALLFGWMNATRLSGEEGHHGLVIAVMLICLVADVGLFASMFRVSRQIELERDNRLLSAKIEAQHMHYEELTEQYETIRRMREDVAGHILAMNELLVSGRSEEAAAYVTELRAASIDRSLGICQHPVVDAYLHNAVQRAAETGVELDIKASVPADVSVADTDLICTFGNLLDNAFEACEGLAGAVISLRAHTSAGYLMISTENPLGGEKEKKARIQGLERGIGLRVLDGLAKKYDGDFRYGEEDGLFRTEITYKL